MLLISFINLTQKDSLKFSIQKHKSQRNMKYHNGFPASSLEIQFQLYKQPRIGNELQQKDISMRIFKVRKTS